MIAVIFEARPQPDRKSAYLDAAESLRPLLVVRRFTEDTTWLRWGLPRSEAEWQRLSTTLSSR